MPDVRKKSTPKEIRALIMVAALNVAMLGIVSYAVGAWFFGERWTETLIGAFDLDDGRFINIYSRESETRHDTKLRYEVKVGGKVVLPRSAAGTAFRPASTDLSTRYNTRDFSIVPAEGGDLVAVTDRTRNDEIVILHDFANNLSWPAHGKDEQEGREVGRFLLRRLQCEFPFFNAAGISTYRPAWVWSPNRSLWLFTLPYSPPDEGGAAATSEPQSGGSSRSGPGRRGGALRRQKGRDALLGVQVWNSQTRRACFIRTKYTCDDFDQHATAGWMDDDVLLLSFGPSATYAWQIVGDGKLSAVSLPVDDAISQRADALLAVASKVAPRSPASSTAPKAERPTTDSADTSW